MAHSTPTPTPHGSATTTNHPHPMSPTATDIPSQSLRRTWLERVVAALLDVWSTYVAKLATCRCASSLHDCRHGTEPLHT
eukprot:scaffold160009_cov56-Attheya_sp.AAC.2